MEEVKKGYLYILIAGTLWATLGLLGDILMKNGLTPEQVAFVRLFLGFVVLSVYCRAKNRELLKISKKGIVYSVIIGIICQGLFNLCYFNAIKSVGVSVAAVLLYTSPLFLALFSKLVYKENINLNKIVSLLVCFIGAIFAVTGGKLDISGLSTTGIIMGILSAITYALMPIISKDALKENNSITILIYGFLFGALFMLPFSKPMEMVLYLDNFKVVVAMLVLGIVPAALAYIFYVEGIGKGVELSIAGVIASIELVVSAFIGWTVIGEAFSIVKLLGVALMVISSIIAIRSISTEKEVTEEIVEPKMA